MSAGGAIFTISTQGRLWLRTLKPANLRPIMIRFASLLFVGLICLLGARSASAQDADSELVTRVDRMEQTIRNLTGQVEQLQYHNQQLEQQVQRLQQQMQGGAPPSSPPPPRAIFAAAARTVFATASLFFSAATLRVTLGTRLRPIRRRRRRVRRLPKPAGMTPSTLSVDPGAPGVPRPLGASTVANEPPPPYEAPPAGTPRQAGTPLDLSSPAAGQGGAPSNGPLPPPPPANPSATGGMQASIAPPPAPRQRRRTSTNSAGAISGARITRMRRKRSAILCTNTRATV